MLNERWTFLSKKKHKIVFVFRITGRYVYTCYCLLRAPKMRTTHSLHLKLSLLPIEFAFSKFTVDIPQLFLKQFNLQKDFNGNRLRQMLPEQYNARRSAVSMSKCLVWHFIPQESGWTNVPPLKDRMCLSAFWTSFRGSPLELDGKSRELNHYIKEICYST